MSKNNAFSLLELAIVFTIISLITAGIMVGNSLVEQSRIQKFISELENINKSVATFVSAYDNHPGDFARAEDFFGASNCVDHSSHSELTCNGDGNRKIGSKFSADGAVGESSYVYTHMQQAKIYTYKTVFTPNTLSNSDNYYTVSAVNTPSFETDGVTGYFAFVGISDFSGKAGAYALLMGSVETASGGDQGLAINAALKGTTSWAIDKKLDDGVFATGNVVMGDDGGGTCDKVAKNPYCNMKYAPLN